MDARLRRDALPPPTDGAALRHLVLYSLALGGYGPTQGVQIQGALHVFGLFDVPKLDVLRACRSLFLGPP